ncbi:MAG: RNA polymerase sigma factor [Blastocatellales bacterium]
MVDNTGISDADLIAKCLNQDAEAWEALVRRYQRLIASITFKYGLSPEDTADIAQSVCITLFQQLPSLRKQDKLSSWIITVTVRECWKFRRRQVPTESLDNPEHEGQSELADHSQELPDEWLLSLERSHLLQRAVEPLPVQCRQLIEYLFYGEEALPYAEISSRMGMPVASIGPTRARCLEKLKESLKKIGFF